MDGYEVRQLRRDELPQMEELLLRVGLRRDGRLDYSAGAFSPTGRLAACGSCAGNTLRCLAVDGIRRGEGLLNQVMAHLIRIQYERGNFHIFLYTKPESALFFTDLGFHEIARTGRTVFMENRRDGFSGYLARLEREGGASAGVAGGLVMNANPFTLGHRYLVEQAARGCETLHLFLVSEDVSVFPTADRLELVKAGCAHLKNISYHLTEDYLISQATFPSYFLPEDEAASTVQAELDGAIFVRIAARLGIQKRWLGSEPISAVTALYNRVLETDLPKAGIACEILPRLEVERIPVSASAVRRALKCGEWTQVEKLVPASTLAYLHTEKGSRVREKLMEGERT